MKRYKLDSETLEGDEWVDRIVEDEEGDYVQYDDAMAEIEAIRAENARLTEALRWEENRADRIGAHNVDCWKWGPSHYECALREIERLKAPPEVLRADEVTEPGWYWWRPYPLDNWRMEDVAWYYVRGDGKRPGESRLMLWDGMGDGETQDLYGEFRGPIPYPESDHADD